MAEKSYFGESKNIEFKREIPKRHEKFLKDIIAFANCTGGKVILGIEDITNVVYGIGDANPFRLSDDITNMILDACTPQIETDITPQTLDGKTVLVIEVFPGKYRPYYLKSFGEKRSAYIRTNGTSRPADEWRLRELEMEGRHIYYDRLPEIGMAYDETMALQLCESMKKTALSECRSEEERIDVKDITLEKMEDMGLLCKIEHNYTPTHAFHLMTTNKVRYAKIQCALFKGLTRDVFIDRKEFTGPIYQQIEEAYQFVCRHTNMGAEINGIVRRDVYELPVRAIREAIINAVAHRSYVDDSCIQVSIYDNRLDVFSPGGLYGGLNIDDAFKGKSKCRNAAISEALHYMKIMEAWGTGLRRIRNACREYELPEPLIEEEGFGFRVTFYRKEANGNPIVVNDAQNSNTGSKKTNTGSKKTSTGLEKASNESTETASARLKDFERYRVVMEEAGIEKRYIEDAKRFYLQLNTETFKQSDIMSILGCSKTKALRIMQGMRQSEIIIKVEGHGFGTYRFC